MRILENNGTISTDAFVGIIASLIGVCATIVVGFQIASILELRDVKREVEQIEKQKAKLESYKKSSSEDPYIAKTGLGNAFGILAVVEKGTLLGFASRISSTVCDNLNSLPGNILLTRYEQLYKETEVLIKTKEYLDEMHPLKVIQIRYLKQRRITMFEPVKRNQFIESSESSSFKLDSKITFQLKEHSASLD